ncbi:MAG TPA: DUF1501 domain-containing protein, partial [Gemmatales bacterium]|nr:DUF1501 domain-containing protein [Gemmatales bacterium]
AYPASSPPTPEDLAAPIYHCLGIDPETLVYDKLQRPHALSHGKVIEPILL